MLMARFRAVFIIIGFLSALAWWHWDVISAAPVLSTALGVSCCCLAVAGGKTKINAIRGVLASGLLHGLITDEGTAKALAD